MGEFTALIVPDATAKVVGEPAPEGLNDLSWIRSAPGVLKVTRYALSRPQRFPGTYPHFLTLVELGGDVGAEAWRLHRRSETAAYRGSTVGVFESMRPRIGEAPNASITNMMIAMTSPKPGCDQEYNDWYWDRHMPDGMRLPGVISVQRFKLHLDLSDAEFPYEYMAHYDMRTDNLVGHIAETNRVSRTPEMPVSEALAKGFA